MNIRFQPQLLEEVVLIELRKQEEQGNFSLFEEYHELADPIYERFPIEERDQQFEKLHLKFFLRLGLGEELKKVLAEFPLLDDFDVLARRALLPGEEKADLRTTGGLKSVEIKLLPALFLDGDRLQRKLRHELMHLSDMLDGDFGYRTEGKLSSHPVEDRIIKGTYSLVWDIYVDGRLTRAGRETIGGREERAEEFDSLYQELPLSSRSAAFEALWNAEGLTHTEILGMAKDPSQLLQRAGLSADRKVTILGSPCPFCSFPTYSWADLGGVDNNVLALIKQDFPAWEAGKGACARCLELYQAKVESK